MNKLLSAILLSFSIVVLCSCDSKDKPTTDAETKTASDLAKARALVLPPDAITVGTLNNWKAGWAAHGKQYIEDSTLLLGFNLPLLDLDSILHENPASSRFYLGIKNAGGVLTPKLMVVGVDAKGYDMVNPILGDYAYDVSSPCPPTCQPN